MAVVQAPSSTVVLGSSSSLTCTPTNLLQPSMHFTQLNRSLMSQNRLLLSPNSPSPPLISKGILESLTISQRPSIVLQPYFSSINLPTAPSSTITVSMLGSPSLTFAFPILPSHASSLVLSSTHSNDAATIPLLDLETAMPIATSVQNLGVPL